MKISQLIKKLKQIKKDYGDLPLYHDTWVGEDVRDFQEIKEIRLEYPRNKDNEEDFSQAPWAIELLSELMLNYNKIPTTFSPDKNS
jgi:hypothetical protein